MKLRSFVFATFLITCSLQSFGQESSGRGIRFNTYVSGGISTFNSSISAPSRFPTMETRVGVGVIKKLNETFELRTRFSLGVKVKRNGFNDKGVVVMHHPFMKLDDLSSNRNHYFYEVPLLLQANLKHPQVGFRAGINYRRFFPNNSDVDALTARGELGVIAGAGYRLSKKFTVSADYCLGLTKMIVMGGSIDGVDYTMNVRNNFAQIGLEYAW